MKYYPVSLNLSGRRCVVIGGGTVAERKVERLLDCAAVVTVVSERLSEALTRLREEGGLVHVCAAYDTAFLKDAFLVFGTTDDPRVNDRIFEDARRMGILVNIADDPAHCDFILPSLCEQGDLQIAVSTGGKSPALARRVREDVEALYGPEYAIYLMVLGELRKKVVARGRPSDDNKRIFEAVVASSILDLIRTGDRAAVRQLLFDLAGEDMETELERLMS